MQKRFLKVLKWFFIILGVIFFMQIVTVTCLAVGVMIAQKSSFSFINDYAPSKNNLKFMQPLISYVENYFNENNKYPDKIEDGIKINKKYTYDYEVSNNNSCYTITLKPVNKETFLKQKYNESTQQYQRCQIKTDSSSSSSESYLEFNK